MKRRGPADRRACAVLKDAVVSAEGDPRPDRLREASDLGLDADNEKIRVAARLLDTALKGDDKEGIRQGIEQMEESCQQLEE